MCSETPASEAIETRNKLGVDGSLSVSFRDAAWQLGGAFGSEHRDRHSIANGSQDTDQKVTRQVFEIVV